MLDLRHRNDAQHTSPVRAFNDADTLAADPFAGIRLSAYAAQISTSVATMPEPGCAVALLAGTVLCQVRRRHRTIAVSQ